MRARRFVAAAALALFPFGCQQIEGLTGLTFVDGGGGGNAGSGGGGGTGSSTCPCVGALPPGWSGPIAVYEGAPGTSPSCPDAYPIQILDGGTSLVAPPATCAACACGAPTVTCSPGPVVTHSHSGCNGSSSSFTPMTGKCTAFTPASDGVKVSDPVSNVGPCAPAGGGATLTPLSWTTEAVACGLPAGVTCPSTGSTCPSPPVPFEARTCIFAQGSQPCPAPYSRDRGWSSSATDDRTCTPCTCGTPGASGCTVTTTVYTDGACSAMLSVLPAGQCTQTPGAQSLSATATIGAMPTCAHGGGSPSGSAVAESALTVCCMP